MAAKFCNACGKYYNISKKETKANAVAFCYSDALDRVCNTISVSNVCPKCIKEVEEMVTKYEEEIIDEEE